MSCDTCGKVTDELETIREFYRTDKVISVCPECMEIINNQLHKLQCITVELQKGWLRRFLDNLHDRSSK